VTWYREIGIVQEPTDMRVLDTHNRSQFFFNVEAIHDGAHDTFIEELVARLVAKGLGTYGTNIFDSAGVAVPDGEGPYLIITETGGMRPERTHNSIETPAYRRPSASLVFKASTTVAARTMARAAYLALVSIRNQDL
jgi:hypothetical protein